MRYRAALVGVAMVMAAATEASASMRISGDAGGRIGTYVQTYSAIRDSGERVVIDGACLSACTLVLGIVPRSRICVTSRAALGFHAAWVPGPHGQPVRSEAGTQALWELYPQHVRRWITARGGLTSKMMILRGRELTAMYPTCRATESASAAPLTISGQGAAAQARKRHSGHGEVRKTARTRVEQAREAGRHRHNNP